MPLVRAVVLAAGAGRRFGGGKLVARLEGRPLLQHVLDRLADAGLDDPIVVLGRDAATIEAAMSWRRAVRVVNPDPGRGLASSLRLGWRSAFEATAAPDAVLVVLGDQPRLRPDLVRAMREAALDPARPIVAGRYGASGARNPVRVEASAAALVAAARGDRGLGPILDARPGLVRWIEVDGANPDVDRAADLEALSRGASPVGEDPA
jgi:CTP:molybdopterin cytidylyltransferase MocA